MSETPAPVETGSSTPTTEQVKPTSPAESSEAKLASASRATRIVNIATKKGPVSFPAREKSETILASTPGSQSRDGGALAPSASAATEETPKSPATAEPAKPEEPKVAPSRALTIALEKEAKLVEERRAFKAERDAFDADKARQDADVKAIQQARALVKEGKRLKALEVLGMTLDEVQDEFLAGLKEETPDEKAARIVRETLAREREAEAQKAKETEEAAAKERTVAEQARVDWWMSQAKAAYEARTDLDPAAFHGVTWGAVWQRAVEEHKATGKLPTSAEAVDLIQKDFDARLATSKRYKPADAPAATEAVKDSPKAKDTPKTITSKGAGSVSIAVRKPQERKSAMERAREAAHELGIKLD